MTIRYATVMEGGANYKVKFFGEDIPSQTIYTRLNNYVPQVGDVAVFLVDDKGKYLCVGAAATAENPFAPTVTTPQVNSCEDEKAALTKAQADVQLAKFLLMTNK